MTTGEIAAHFDEVYGAKVRKDTISRITDKVLEEMPEWRTVNGERDILGLELAVASRCDVPGASAWPYLVRRGMQRWRTAGRVSPDDSSTGFYATADRATHPRVDSAQNV